MCAHGLCLFAHYTLLHVYVFEQHIDVYTPGFPLDFIEFK